MRMTTAKFAAFASVVGAALLAACGGTNGIQPSPGLAAPSSRFAAPLLGSAAKPGVVVGHRTVPGARRVRPNPCCIRTLFVSDPGTNTVQLYGWPNGVYMGQLSAPTFPAAAFNQPQGECTDVPNPQHVFIANTSASTIDEYTHGGAFVQELADPGEYPVSCAYRQTGPASGVLAVSNIYTVAAPQMNGSISVYVNNNGSWTGPTIYNPPGSQDRELYYIDYRGNTLYIDGFHLSLQFYFVKMSPGGAFTQIPLAGAPCAGINFPGGVQNISNYIAVGDQSPNPGCPNILHVATSGAVIGSTTLTPSPTDLVEFAKQGPRMVGVDYGGPNANIYAYGTAAGLLTPITAPLVSPLGAAISRQ